MTRRVKLRDSDPTEQLGLDELVDLVGEEKLPELRERGAKRLKQLDSLSLATLERSMKRGNTQAAIYVHKVINHKTADDSLVLPKSWANAKTIAERARIVDKLLAKGALSPAQARAVLDLGEAVQLQREIETLKAQIAELQRGDQPSAPSKKDKPPQPSVKRIAPPADNSDLY